MTRVPFETVFKINDDESISPRQVIRIGGVTITPEVTINPGAIYGGIDITQHKKRDLQITIDNGTMVITGIY